MSLPGWLRCLSIAAAILLPTAPPLSIAQLEGFVRDPSEAVVPAVAVVAKNKASGIAFEATTNNHNQSLLPIPCLNARGGAASHETNVTVG